MVAGCLACGEIRAQLGRGVGSPGGTWDMFSHVNIGMFPPPFSPGRKSNLIDMRFFLSCALLPSGPPQPIVGLHRTPCSVSSPLASSDLTSSFTTTINLLSGPPDSALPPPICPLSIICACADCFSVAQLVMSVAVTCISFPLTLVHTA